MTGDLARRFEQAELEFTASRFSGLEQVPGNPMGVAIRRLDHIGVLTMSRADAPIPNLVLGIRDGDEARLDEIFAGLEGRDYLVGIIPLTASGELLTRLAERGLYQAGFQTILYGRPCADWPAPPSDVTVRAFTGQESGEFAEFVNAIDNVPAAERPFWQKLRQGEFSAWRGYVAFVDGVPAARAAMAIRDGLATLGFATTHPSFRRRGCQTALLHRRLADADAAHCDLVLSGANPNTVSERNQQRAGLRIACTRVNWKPFRKS